MKRIAPPVIALNPETEARLTSSERKFRSLVQDWDLWASEAREVRAELQQLVRRAAILNASRPYTSNQTENRKAFRKCGIKEALFIDTVELHLRSADKACGDNTLFFSGR